MFSASPRTSSTLPLSTRSAHRCGSAHDTGTRCRDAADFILSIGPVRANLNGIDAAVIDRVRNELIAGLQPHQTSEGVRIPGAVWMVTATRPWEVKGAPAFDCLTNYPRGVWYGQSTRWVARPECSRGGAVMTSFFRLGQIGPIVKVVVTAAVSEISWPVGMPLRCCESLGRTTTSV